MYCESWSLRRELSFVVWSHDHLITWSCCLWASQCNAQSVYVSITYAYRAVTALLMRLFSSSDKHSLQKIRSQHLIQINFVVDLNSLIEQFTWFFFMTFYHVFSSWFFIKVKWSSCFLIMTFYQIIFMFFFMFLFMFIFMFLIMFLFMTFYQKDNAKK